MVPDHGLPGCGGVEPRGDRPLPFVSATDIPRAYNGESNGVCGTYSKHTRRISERYATVKYAAKSPVKQG